MIPDEGVISRGDIVRAFQVGQKNPLFSKYIEGFMVTEKVTLSSSGFELIFPEKDKWKIYDLKVNKERCSLQVQDGKVISEVEVEDDIAVGNLCPTSDPFCTLSGPFEIATWDLATCKISRVVQWPGAFLYQLVWLDQDRLLVWDGGTFALVNFNTGSVKTTSVMDGYPSVQATLSKGSREVIAATMADGHHSPAGMMVYRIPFDSIR